MTSILRQRRLQRQQKNTAPEAVKEAASSTPIASKLRQSMAKRATQSAVNPSRAARQQTTVQDLEFYRLVMDEFLDMMRDIEDIEARKGIKAEAVTKVRDFVQDYLDKDALYPNIVAVRMAIWLFDLGDMQSAVPLALYLIKQDIHKTPMEFNSDLPTFVCDTVYDWANTKLKKNEGAGPYLQQVVDAMVEDGWDVNDIVRGKMLAMLGKHLELSGQDELAHDAYVAALKENDGAGVKKRLEQIKKKLGNE